MNKFKNYKDSISCHKNNAPNYKRRKRIKISQYWIKIMNIKVSGVYSNRLKFMLIKWGKLGRTMLKKH